VTSPSSTNDFRREVKAFLAEYLPADWAGRGALPEHEREEFLIGWRAALVERGWLVPGWPKEHGGAELEVSEQSVLAEELTAAGLPGLVHPNDGYGLLLLGGTLLHWGTEDQKKRFLGPTVAGELKWAQGYSEPDAGSDLFNASTRAELVGGMWVVNGRKIWQSAGTTANWIFALVRTGTPESRAKGLSFLLIPIDQPGVEVRGINNMANEVDFAEVTFTDAVTAEENLVGGLDNGASVALTLLGFERGAGGVAEALAHRLELDRLAELIRGTGQADDPVIRQRFAACCTAVHAMHCHGLRTLSAGVSGAPLGPESSIKKLVSSEYRKTVTELAMDVLAGGSLTLEGTKEAELLGPQPLGLDPMSARAWVQDFLHARPGTVYGGSSEIQRNTIGEQVLKLPREPRVAITRPAPSPTGSTL
jgi:alkylation response protein AidB-like acyl-CoA dehydrogenase